MGLLYTSIVGEIIDKEYISEVVRMRSGYPIKGVVLYKIKSENNGRIYDTYFPYKEEETGTLDIGEKVKILISNFSIRLSKPVIKENEKPLERKVKLIDNIVKLS